MHSGSLPDSDRIVGPISQSNGRSMQNALIEMVGEEWNRIRRESHALSHRCSIVFRRCLWVGKKIGLFRYEIVTDWQAMVQGL